MKNLRTKLSYTLYFVLVAFLFTACNYETESTNNIKEETKIGKNLRGNITVVEVEGCEYIVWDWYDAGNIVHKHNCKFCEERSK